MVLILGWMVLGTLAPAEVAWEKIGSEEQLESTLQILADFREGDELEARSRLNDLDDRFRQAVLRYREESQASGDLEAVLAVNQALEVLEGGGVPNGSRDATVARLEKIYADNRPAAEEDFRRRLAVVRAKHLEELKGLQAALTKVGKFDLALMVKTRIEEYVASISEEAEKPEAAKAVVAGSRQDNRIGLSADSVVVIQKATYGSGDRHADVTATVKRLVESERKSFAANPTDLGADPFPYRSKGLVIEYTRDGKQQKQRRGENETILISSFYGPQDVADLRKALVGSQWRADETIEFRADNSFTVDGRRGSFRWSVQDSTRKVTLTWGNSKKSVGRFDWSWTEFKEEGEGGRVFVNLAFAPK